MLPGYGRRLVDRERYSGRTGPRGAAQPGARRARGVPGPVPRRTGDAGAAVLRLGPPRVCARVLRPGRRDHMAPGRRGGRVPVPRGTAVLARDPDRGPARQQLHGAADRLRDRPDDRKRARDRDRRGHHAPVSSPAPIRSPRCTAVAITRRVDRGRLRDQRVDRRGLTRARERRRQIGAGGVAHVGARGLLRRADSRAVRAGVDPPAPRPSGFGAACSRDRCCCSRSSGCRSSDWTWDVRSATSCSRL